MYAILHNNQNAYLHHFTSIAIKNKHDFPVTAQSSAEVSTRVRASRAPAATRCVAARSATSAARCGPPSLPPCPKPRS